MCGEPGGIEIDPRRGGIERPTPRTLFSSSTVCGPAPPENSSLMPLLDSLSVCGRLAKRIKVRVYSLSKVRVMDDPTPSPLVAQPSRSPC